MKTLAPLVLLAAVDTSAGDPPGPPPELAGLDWLVGQWECVGNAGGPPFASDLSFARILDGFWIVAEYHQKPTHPGERPTAARATIGWDGSWWARKGR